MSKLQRYSSYKESGVEWLGEIPEHWAIVPGMKVYRENKRKNIGMIEDRVLSLSYGNIIVKPIEKLVGLVPESFETYQIVQTGDIIIRCMDLQNDKTSLRTGFSKNHGIITSAYLNLNVLNGHAEYLYYYLHALDLSKVIYKFGTGLRQNLSFIDFKRLPIVFPPVDEQYSIVNFLNKKSDQIDQAIRQKEQLIELLKERRQIVINEAVTKGINLNVPMKESGVEWIGEIPEHWNILANRYIFTIKKNLVGKRSSEYDLLSLTLQGIIKRDMDNPQGKFPAEFDTYQEVKQGDFIFCLFDVEETPRTVGLSKFDGMITGAYTVMSVDNMNKNYLYYFYLNLDSKKRLKPLYKGLRNTIPKDSFFAFKTFVPPIDEQLQIVAYIEEHTFKIDATIELQQNYITKLKEYKATLIDGVVTGKVRVA